VRTHGDSVYQPPLTEVEQAIRVDEMFFGPEGAGSAGASSSKDFAASGSAGKADSVHAGVARIGKQASPPGGRAAKQIPASEATTQAAASD
jgi:hypothetical protein